MDDIYENLQNYDDFSNLETLKSENKELKSKLDEYQVSMGRLKKDIFQDLDLLTEKHERLLENFSTLLKTAKAEIERKTSIITVLNNEKDELILSIKTGQFKNAKNNQVTKLQKHDKKKRSNSLKSSGSERSHSTDSTIHRLKESDRPKLNGNHTESKENNKKGSNSREKENLDSHNLKSSRIMNRRKSTGVLNTKYSSDEDGEILDESDHSSKMKHYDKPSGYNDYHHRDDRTRRSRFERFHREPERSRDSRIHRSAAEKSDNHSSSRYSSRYKRKDSPQRNKYARTKSTDRRYLTRDYERCEDRLDRNRNIPEKETLKQKLPPANEAPACKRQRLNSNSRLMEISNDGPFELSCRSPDYVDGLTNFVPEPVKEIKHNRSESLQDPREHSERYQKTLDKNSKQCLVSVSGKNVDLLILDWSEKPEAMEEPESHLVKEPNDYCLSINNQNSVKPNEWDNENVGDLYGNIAEPTFSDDDTSNNQDDDVGDELLFGHTNPNNKQPVLKQATESLSPVIVNNIETAINETSNSTPKQTNCGSERVLPIANITESSTNHDENPVPKKTMEPESDLPKDNNNEISNNHTKHPKEITESERDNPIGSNNKITKYHIPKKSNTKVSETKIRGSSQHESKKAMQTEIVKKTTKKESLSNLNKCKEFDAKKSETNDILVKRKFEGTVESDLQLSDDENSGNSSNESEVMKIENKKPHKSPKTKHESKIKNDEKDKKEHSKNKTNPKFTELFGDSSLITPDDLGIESKKPSMSFENHSDESNEIYWSLLGDSARSNSVQNVTENATHHSENSHLDENKSSQKDNVDNVTKESVDHEKLKPSDAGDQINIKEVNVPKAKAEIRKSIFETPIKCVATSTPQRESAQTSLPDISTSSTDSKLLSNSHTEPRTEGDAPDIKIVIRRKKKFPKKTS